MSDESLNTGLLEPSGRHKFPAGNKFGRGNPMAKAVNRFRRDIIKNLRKGKSVPKIIRRMKQLAGIPDEGDEPIRDVEPAVQLAALKELLSRAVGKADQTVNVKDVGPAKPTYNLDQLIAAVIAAGGDPDRFPMLAAHRRKLLEAKVSNPKEAP
jgi:hypothetical protein